MPTLRRLYLYGVAQVSLLGLMAGLIVLGIGLTRLMTGAGPLALGGFVLAGPVLAAAALLALICGAVWGLHWWLANRRAAALTMAGAAERSAPARKAYFYISRFFAFLALAALAGLLVYDLIAVVLAAPTIGGEWPAGPLSLAVGVLIAFLFWFYLYRAARADGDTGHEQDAGAGWRRAYDYLVLVLATVAASAGAVGLIQAGLVLFGRRFAGGPAGATIWHVELAAGLAALVVAGPIARWHWRRADWVVADDPTGQETNSLGRKLALYLLLLGGIAVSVLSVAYLVVVSTQLLLGQPVGDLTTVWEQTIAPLLGYLPVGPVLWWVFGRALWNDVAWAPETRAAARLRHLYFYLLAGILLAGFWWGLQQVLAVILFLALGLEQLTGLAEPAARSTFALALGLCLAAGPAWWWHWSRAQAWVEELRYAGRDDRASIMRRIYLYGVIVAAAAVVIVTLAIVVTRAPALLLGPHTQADVGASLIQFGVAVALALIWWLSYGFVLREDAAVRAEEEGAEEAPAEAGEAAPFDVAGDHEASAFDEGPWDTGPAAGAQVAPDQSAGEAGAGDQPTPLAGVVAASPPAVPPVPAVPPARSRRRGQFSREELAAGLAAFEAGQAAAGDQAAASAEEPDPAGDAGPAAGAQAETDQTDEQAAAADQPAAAPAPPVAGSAATPPPAVPPVTAVPLARPQRRGQFSREELAAGLAAFEAGQAAAARLAQPPAAAGDQAAAAKEPGAAGDAASGESLAANEPARPAAADADETSGGEPSLVPGTVDAVQPGGGEPAAPNELTQAAADAAEAPAVVVVDGGAGVIGAAVLQALRRELPEATLWPIGLNDAAQDAMYRAAGDGEPAGEGVPVDALQRALVIVGPRGMAVAGGLAGEVPPELAAAIGDSPARKVILQPLAMPGRAVAAPGWALERWAAQAVAEVGAVIKGNQAV